MGTIAIATTAEQRQGETPGDTPMWYVETDTGRVFQWTGSTWLQEFYVTFTSAVQMQLVMPDTCDCEAHVRLDLSDRFVRIMSADYKGAYDEALRLFSHEYAEVLEVQPTDLRELEL